MTMPSILSIGASTLPPGHCGPTTPYRICICPRCGTYFMLRAFRNYLSGTGNDPRETRMFKTVTQGGVRHGGIACLYPCHMRCSCVADMNACFDAYHDWCKSNKRNHLNINFLLQAFGTMRMPLLSLRGSQSSMGCNRLSRGTCHGSWMPIEEESCPIPDPLSIRLVK